jgi:hypothetical protein
MRQAHRESEHRSLVHLAFHLDVAVHCLQNKKRGVLFSSSSFCGGSCHLVQLTWQSFLLMARPSPDPPNLRPTLASNCEKLCVATPPSKDIR